MECMVKGEADRGMAEWRDREQTQKTYECRPRETEEVRENVKRKIRK